MSTLVVMPSPTPFKRTHDPIDLASSNKPTLEPNNTTASPARAIVTCYDRSQNAPPSSSRGSSPLSSTATLPSSTPEKTTNIQLGPPTEGPPTKKRKLTFEEKETLRIEKQFKDLQKAEEKARKEAEKRQKEEQKRVEIEAKEEKRKIQEEEREKKRKAKEAEKAEKEENKRRKDAEKEKKDKGQLRLNAFFKKPAPSPGSANSSRRSSIASIDGPGSITGSRVGSEQPEQVLLDYEKAFPPFFLHAHTAIAPLSQFVCDPERAQWALAQIEGNAGRYDEQSRTKTLASAKRRLDEALEVPQNKRRKRYVKPVTVKSIIAQINGSVEHPIDLTAPKDSTARTPLEILRAVPVKYLKYAEDVRPPYIGTYTKVPAGHSIAKLCRNPFTRALPAINYDYDSEAEWEEPEEGEDLDSEGEEEGDEDDEEDMEGFLDDGDAENNGPKRRHIMGDIEPVCTGLQWESDSPTKRAHVPFGASTIDFSSFRIDLLLGDPILSIDPYSTSYWASTVQPSSSNQHPSSSATMAPPPRVPLNTLKGPNNMLSTQSFTSGSDPASKSQTVRPQAKSKASAVTKPMPPELLDDFKRAVEGSDLTKAGLVEVLKKRFPQVTKNTVLETLQQVAHRVGKKEADKKWCLL